MVTPSTVFHCNLFSLFNFTKCFVIFLTLFFILHLLLQFNQYHEYYFFVGGECAFFDPGVGRVIAKFNSKCLNCPIMYNTTESWKCKLYFFISHKLIKLNVDM